MIGPFLEDLRRQYNEWARGKTSPEVFRLVIILGPEEYRRFNDEMDAWMLSRPFEQRFMHADLLHRFKDAPVERREAPGVEFRT